ncbi:hypothetical protein Nepgr_018514 [Nepenthes gracilis]|uniref:Retrotransposon Copia-like N-terminal domain-containing protein n=1 Tax=Nepenthes gracilis TaxID=150966 RepID=A0AAD3SSE1_NEPGR|nr:hypothetical protein Nepgr_018514 [Nepenthes gracilis]
MVSERFWWLLLRINLPLSPILFLLSLILKKIQLIHISSGDSPGVLLMQQILAGENYASWSCSMKIALSSKNKLGFVDGSLPNQEADGPHLSAWLRCNHMVTSWLLNSLSKGWQRCLVGPIRKVFSRKCSQSL